MCLSDFYGEIRKGELSGLLVLYIEYFSYFWAFSERRRAIVDRIRWGMNLIPSFFVYFVYVDVIFLFCDVLNPSEHVYQIFVFKHRVTSSWLF